MRPRLPLVLLAGVFLTSILWLLVLQGNIRDRSGETVGLDGVATPLDKPSLLAVVGVQTGFARPGATAQYDYALRRQALRATWFPSSQEELSSYEQSTSIKMFFVIGHTTDVEAETAVAQEATEHGGFMRLPIQEAYMSLTQKTLAFLKAVVSSYNARYIVKIDDDVYLRTDRLTHALLQYQEISADYIGCMKTGPIQTDAHYRWHEPQHEVLGSSNYFTHAWGSMYILSGRVAAQLAAMSPGMLRFFANEDVTVGSWMLAFNVTHLDDRRLCQGVKENCSPAAVAVYDYPTCPGLCDPAASLPRLHADQACQAITLDPRTRQLPKLRPYFGFQHEW